MARSALHVRGSLSTPPWPVLPFTVRPGTARLRPGRQGLVDAVVRGLGPGQATDQCAAQVFSPARRRSPGVMIVSGPGRSRIMASTVADVMVPTLRASGARRVYGIPGNSLNGFTLTRCTGTARSSGSTSGMRRPRDSRPAAEAALTGEVAVCAASLWAGNLHLINGLAIRRPGGKAGSWKTRCGRRSGTTARRWSRWPPPGTSCRCRPGSPTARSTASPSTGPGPSRPGSEELIQAHLETE